ncbi:MAG: IS481 family transposase, partial [Gammaproteobacteria bacterium]
VQIRYARWDLATCDLIDAHSGAILCALYPLDKAANAAGLRRRLDPVTNEPSDSTASASRIAPLLRKLMADYAATGLPPAYLPTPQLSEDDPEPAP